MEDRRALADILSWHDTSVGIQRSRGRLRAEGRYRVIDRVCLDDLVLSTVTTRVSSRWREPIPSLPIHREGLVSQLVSTPTPKAARDIHPADDQVLGELLRGRTDCLAVPVYFGGDLTEWLLVFRPSGWLLDPMQVRILVATLNLMSRGVYAGTPHRSNRRASRRAPRQDR